MKLSPDFSIDSLVKIIINGLLVICPCISSAQSPFKDFSNLFTPPKNYVVNYVKTAPVIDGDIKDVAWNQAHWTEDFKDIEGNLKPIPLLKTKVKILWSDSCLYIAAQIHDPQVWATITRHDDIIFRDNDFEVFINPNNTTHQYFEMEFNALNTLFDLFLNKPYRNGGNAMFGWNADGLRSAVKIQGTLNDATDTDMGWTIEIAIPFKAISLGNDVQTPNEGTLWRINFSRVEWDTLVSDGKYVKVKDAAGRNLPEHNWVWSPQGVVDMHYPERWGYLQFTKANATFNLPYSEKQRQYLWLVYYHEKLWYKNHQVYESVLKNFGIDNKVTIDGQINSLQLEATGHQFMALITNDKDKITWTINQEGLISRLTTTVDE
jgi:hypothetical protein